MSRLIIGETCFQDVETLIKTLAEMLQDQSLVQALTQMLKQGGVMMSRGYGETGKVDFFVSRGHRNFIRAFQRGSYTDIGFKQKGKTWDIHCDDPEYFTSRIRPRYQENVVKKMARKIGLRVRKKQLQDQSVELFMFN